MTPALAKAFTLCMAIGHVGPIVPGPDNTARQPMVYPVGFERCDAILAEEERERRAADDAAVADFAAQARKVYADGLRDLPEGRGP
jgi:hypothetical protein